MLYSLESVKNNEISYKYNIYIYKTKKLNSGALVRQRTIPTEQPLLVGEVSAYFSE
jgi:hypothetical protein